MIISLLLVLLSTLSIIVGFKGDLTVNRTRQEIISGWDEMKGRPPEYTSRRYKKPNYVSISFGILFILFGLLSFFGR
jgi:hypothetical protein